LRSENSKINNQILQKDQELKEIEAKLSSNRCYEMYFQGDVFDSEPYD
jgi:hypothetical protein